MQFSLQSGIFLLFLSAVCGYQTFVRQILGSALMGDLLSTLPSRFQCVGAGKNFTHFLLFSRIHPDKPHPLRPDDQDMLVKSDFDPTVPTKIIIHGFVDNFHLSDWMQRMKTRFLSAGDYNVIIVDWSCGNEFPYFQAIQNSKIVADELKKLIHFLRDSRGAEAGDFHLIGHSLGSHIAGLVGHGVPHLGRISALDPAGPRFYDAPLEERLDPSDAQFVDAIHTDAGSGLIDGLGMRMQVGHVDFYPNGGRDQPGCHSSPFTILPRIGIQRVARYYITCDHFRSIEYYIESIRPMLLGPRFREPTCQLIGVACRDWETYAQGRCADCTHPGDCAAMGYQSDLNMERGPSASRYEYYVKTAEDDPFCLFQYQVLVETGCGHEFCGDTTDLRSGFNPGVIRLELQTGEGKLARLNLDDYIDKELKPGAQYVYLATSRYPLGEVRGAKVWWGYASKPEMAASFRSDNSGLNLKKIQVIPIDLPEKIKRFSMPELTVLCGSTDKTIQRNQYLELSINNC